MVIHILTFCRIFNNYKHFRINESTMVAELTDVTTVTYVAESTVVAEVAAFVCLR
jgi:hypothetical protein